MAETTERFVDSTDGVRVAVLFVLARLTSPAPQSLRLATAWLIP